MRVFKKSGDTLEILCRAGEINIKIGEYLLLYEGEYNMIAQVLDVSYVDIPGILEDLLRDLTVEDSEGRTVFDPYNISSLGLAIRESKVLKCKIRGISRSSEIEPNSGWLPSRFNTSVRRAELGDIRMFQRTPNDVEIHLGEVLGQPFKISAKTLDGSLTIITGKKESGKSHLAKLLVEGLARHGAVVVVFDVNGEYVNLGKTVDGRDSTLAKSLKILVPGRTLTTSLEEMGLKCFMDILEHVYSTPSTSCREMARIWATLERGGKPITLTNLIEYVIRAPMNESVREALVSRLQSISHTGFINDDGEPTRLEKILQPNQIGTVVVVDLSQLLPSTRRLTVEYLLTTISKLLSRNIIRPVFLLAEEAHLYLRETYWEDIVTRMRHLGIFPIFVTNQPDSIPELVYRQADNIFLFNFSNENDFERLARVSKVDGETVKLLGKVLPARSCLVLGKTVADIPVVLSVKRSELATMGATKLFFTEHLAQQEIVR